MSKKSNAEKKTTLHLVHSKSYSQATLCGFDVKPAMLVSDNATEFLQVENRCDHCEHVYDEDHPTPPPVINYADRSHSMYFVGRGANNHMHAFARGTADRQIWEDIAIAAYTISHEDRTKAHAEIDVVPDAYAAACDERSNGPDQCPTCGNDVAADGFCARCWTS